MHIYHLTWAGFTLLILIWGQCEGLTTGISAERNFTPTSFFCFHKFGCFSVNGDDDRQGSVGQHTYLCAIYSDSQVQTRETKNDKYIYLLSNIIINN